MALTATRTPRAELLRDAEAGYRKRYPEGPPRAELPRNIGPALLLAGADSLELVYRGRIYELGFPSFADGVRLEQARAAVELMEEEPTAEHLPGYARALELTVSLATRYLFPALPTPDLPRLHRLRIHLRRLRWRLRLRRNPYRDATEAEVGQLLGFFLRSRMRSRAGSPTGSGPARRLIFSTES